jgi:hypothetical protein
MFNVWSSHSKRGILDECKIPDVFFKEWLKMLSGEA